MIVKVSKYAFESVKGNGTKFVSVCQILYLDAGKACEWGIEWIQNKLRWILVLRFRKSQMISDALAVRISYLKIKNISNGKVNYI